MKLGPRRAVVLLAALLLVFGLAVSARAAGPSADVVRSIVTLRGFTPSGWIRTDGSGVGPTLVTPDAVSAEAARVNHLDAAISGLETHLGIHPIATYRYALQGFAADLTSAQRALLARDPQVAGIAPVRAVRPAGGTVPVGVERVNAEPPSDGGPTPPNVSGVNVAVVDTGVRFIRNDPDLNMNPKGIDCADDQKNGGTGHSAWADVDSHVGHGTHVAGTIGAEGVDVYGVAPGVRLYSVRVFALRAGKLIGDTASVACGLDWVASTHSVSPPPGTRPIDVVNISLQGPRESGDPTTCPKPTSTLFDAEHQATCAIARLGITVVGAAGNSAKDASTSVPAAWSDVIAVGTIADFDGKPGDQAGSACSEEDDDWASFSNHGSTVALVAPGVCVTSLGLTVGDTHVMSGTSMSAPHVSGAAARLVALLRARGQAATPAVIRRALIGSANLDWDAASDPDPVAHRLLDVAAAESHASAVAAWALPAAISLTADETSSLVQVQLQRRGLYDGDVTLSADAPQGLVVDLMPQTASTADDPPLRGLGNRGTLRTIRIAANGIAEGTYTVTITAVRSGRSGPDANGTLSIPVTVDTSPPSIDQFGAALVDSVAAGTAQPVELDWSGTDAGSGISFYSLQRDTGSGWDDISPFPPTSTTTVTLAPIKQDTNFRLQAIDGVGNESATATITVHPALRDSRKSAISYAGSGVWKTRTDVSAFGGSVARSRTGGAFAITSFSGAGVAWIAPTGPKLGTAAVSIDGGSFTTISLATPKSHERRIVFVANGLSAASHTIEVKVLSGIVDIDAFEFLAVSGP